jgi:hypothetical protein
MSSPNMQKYFMVMFKYFAIKSFSFLSRSNPCEGSTFLVCPMATKFIQHWDIIKWAFFTKFQLSKNYILSSTSNLLILVSFVVSTWTYLISQPNELKTCQIIVHLTLTTPDKVFGYISFFAELQKPSSVTVRTCSWWYPSAQSTPSQTRATDELISRRTAPQTSLLRPSWPRDMG